MISFRERCVEDEHVFLFTHQSPIGPFSKLLVAAALILFQACGSPPGDKFLLKKFPSIFPKLEQLVQEIPGDGSSIRIAQDWANSSKNEQELKKIRATLDVLGIKNGIATGPGQWLFIVDVYGIAGRGWSKGYAYIPRLIPEATVRDSLDDLRVMSRNEFAVRPIEGFQGWYLFVEL
jgi:hypothetical protein